jgi:hexosaminidase
MKKQTLTAVFLTLLCLYGCDNQTTSESPPKPLTNQAVIDQIADSLVVSFEVLENRGDGNCLPGIKQSCYKAAITLTSPHAITSKDWSIYFSSVDKLNRSLPGEFVIDHVNGDLNRISPSETFTAFAAGESKTIEFVVNGLNLTEARMMPNYYVVSDTTDARTIVSTRPYADKETGLEVRPYAKDLDWKNDFVRALGDNTQLADSNYLYNKNSDIRQDKSKVDIGIIPSPSSISRKSLEGSLSIHHGFHIASNDFSKQSIKYALSHLEALNLIVNDSADNTPIVIKRIADNQSKQGSYKLDIALEQITIESSSASGAAYAIASIGRLVDLKTESLPFVIVEDSPRFQFRGMHVDVSRNFHSKTFILKLMDQMANYKMNKLHLHLGDDEGWRLEIQDLPELTDLGSRRCHDLQEKECLLPQLGSGADPDPIRDGFYTKSDYLEILRAATERHIQVIPSFDMPGHSRAAVKAMEARYHDYMRKEQPEKATEFLLSDFDDTTEYSSIQHYNDNTINVCLPSSYAFISKVIDEIKILHDQADHPLTRYHIGADETAGAWIDSPECKALFDDPQLAVNNAHDLAGYFIEKIAALLHEKGIEPAGWSDGMSNPRIRYMPPVVQTNLWETLYSGGHKTAHDQVNRGWQAVLSTPDALYFDFPHETHPKEAGYNWGSRHTNTRKIFEFMPGNLPAHAEFWQNNVDAGYQLDDRESMLQAGKGFIGIQGHLWSETIRTDDQAQYQIFPRLLALAERAWHEPDWEVPYNYGGEVYSKETKHFTQTMREQRDEEWTHFANTLGHKEFLKLDKEGVFYRIPTVGAKVIDEKLHANLIFPGLPIEYRTKGSQWKPYTSPIDISTETEIRARSADKKRAGRSEFVMQP